MPTLLPRVDPLSGRPRLDASFSDTPDAATAGAPDPALVRDHDLGRSLMDRAQRRIHAQDELEVRQRVHLQRAATSSFERQAQLAEVDRQSQRLADAERLQFGRRQLSQAFDADALSQSLQTIRDVADPIEQRVRLTQLRSRYAPFAANPDLAQRIDTQIDALEPVVQRNEEAALLQSILAGRYAPTLTEARTAFPGRKINTLAHPGTGTTFFVPDKVAADPDLEAEAVQVVLNASRYAQLTGNPHALLDTVLEDEAYRRVSRIPGNRASAVFQRELLALNAPHGSPAPSAAKEDTGFDLANPDSPAPMARPGGRAQRPADDYTHLRYPLVRQTRKPYPPAPLNPQYAVDPLTNFPLEAKTTWNYSRNERIIDVPPGMSVDAALSAVRKDFETFKTFSVAKNNIAEAVVDKAAQRAFFTLGALRTAGSGLGAGNDAAVGVALKKSGDTQAAITLANHQLRGIRTWEAEDLKDGRISIRTEAFEIPRLGPGSSSIFNAVGTKLMRGDQAAVWDTYFKNIDEAYFGGGGEVIPFHHKLVADAIENPFAGYFKHPRQAASASARPPPPDSTASVVSPRSDGAGEKVGGDLPPPRENRPAAQTAYGEGGEQKAAGPQNEKPDETSAFALGWEWVAGKGPRQRVFREGDKVTTQIQSSPEVIEARGKMARRIARADFRDLAFGRNAGAEPVLTYPVNFAVDLFKNPTRAFLGSYGAKAEIMEVNEDSAVVRYTITNKSGLESASRLPVFGYEKRSDGSARPTLTEMMSFQASTDIKEWSDLVPRSILPNNAYDLDGPGPGSDKEQAIIWFETLPIKTTRR